MKRQEKTYRFYIWDYLWWAGERLHDYHQRIAGIDMVQMYLTFFLFFPLVTLCAFTNRTLCIYLLALFIVQILVGMIWGEKIYSTNRRKAVMKHYADRTFSPRKGYFLFLLPFLFFLIVDITLILLM